MQITEHKIDVEAETAKVAQELDAQEWNMQEIERRQRMQVRSEFIATTAPTVCHMPLFAAPRRRPLMQLFCSKL